MGFASLTMTSIVLGGLAFMNTWDFPIYGAIFIGASLLGRWLRREPLLPALLYGAGVMALGYLIYLPFYATFSSQARGIGVNLFNGTRLPQFVMMFAPFLIAAAGFIWLVAREIHAPARSVATRAAGLTALIVLAGLVAVALFGLLSSEARALAQELNTSGVVLGVTRDRVSQRLIARAINPWTILTLGGGIALCAALILALKRNDLSENRQIEIGAASPAACSHSLDAFVLLLFGAGAILTLSVEFVFLQDLFGTRMNTVFKLYYQAWTLWSVAGAFAIMRLLAQRHIAAKVIGSVALAFVAAGLLWPVMSASARTNGFAGQPTLDGAAYMQRSNPDDAKIIDWLNKNTPGDATIVEASTLGAYQYEGRISAFTGLPAILGWGGHQHQWRGSIEEPARRHPLVERIYNSTDLGEARSLLQEFGVRFVIVGDIERARYTAEGLAKFEQMCATAFQSGNSAIYRCD
jgi:YYY domain-containing protein